MKPKKRGNRTAKAHKKKPAISKTSFEVYAGGVKRLKELELQLNSLDTRGFIKEEQDIRSRLKKVSDIPYIERKLTELIKKIEGKYAPKKRKSSNSSKIIKQEIKEIKEEEIPTLRKGIKNLNKVQDKEFPEIKRKIKNLSEIEEEELKGIKNISRNMPEIDQKIQDLSGNIKSITKKSKGAVDTGVGILVDTNFNEFLRDVKIALSNRITGREEEMDNVLKTDLQEREEKFREKYAQLVREFNQHKRKVEGEITQKYNSKVKNELRKEVSENFNDALRKKIDSIKTVLGKKYKAELRLHAEEKIKSEEEGLKRYKINLEKNEETWKEHQKEKLVEESHKNLDKALAIKEKILRKQLQEEFALELKKKIQEHEEELKKRKLDLEIELQKKARQLLS